MSSNEMVIASSLPSVITGGESQSSPATTCNVAILSDFISFLCAPAVKVQKDNIIDSALQILFIITIYFIIQPIL